MKGRPFIHFLFNIALCDCITALTYSWGFPPKGSFICKAQGFLSIFFSRASWLWTDVLISQLYYFIVYKDLCLTMPAMHGIVWFISIVLQIIPFFHIDYGAFDDNLSIPNNQLCFYSSQNNDHFAAEYSRYAYFFILTISFVLIFTFTLIIACQHRLQKDIWKKLIFYPAGLFIAWIPNAIYNWYSTYYIDKDLTIIHFYAVDNYLIASNSLYGIILSLFFFSQHIDARILFWNFIKQKVLCYKSNNDDNNGLDSFKIQMRMSDLSEQSFISTPGSDTGMKTTTNKTISTSNNALRINNGTNE